MHSTIANSRPVRLVLPVAILLAVVPLLRPAEERLAREVGGPGLPRAQMLAMAGRGGILAAMGGLRSVVAGGFWLRASAAWERCDANETAALIDLAVAADERPLYFWLNGARMIAYDLPEWELAGAPAAVRRKVIAEHADRALRLLERGISWHGPAAALFEEMGTIRLRRLGDLEGAARDFRLAALEPGAPYHAARIHAELLRALGRPEDALHWLREVAPGLPADEPAARREVVLGRIRELELAVRASATGQEES